jgi:hypothetical protein
MRASASGIPFKRRCNELPVAGGPEDGTLDSSAAAGLSTHEQVRRAVFEEFTWLLGLPQDSLLRRGLQPILQPILGRFADLAAEFDQAVAQVGLPAAIRPYAPRFTERISVTGAEALPSSGPLLIVSNHPGGFDLFLVLSCLPRNDIRIIVSEISILHRLPATDCYFVSIGKDASNSVAAAKAGVRHLRQGGALFLFPGGIVDPDPACMPDAVMSLQRWSPSLELFLRRVPETKVVVCIVSGVLSPGWLASPITRLRQERKDRQKVAEACQTAQQLLWPQSIRLRPLLTFDHPMSVAELSSSGDPGTYLAAIQRRARLLLALRNGIAA